MDLLNFVKLYFALMLVLLAAQIFFSCIDAFLEWLWEKHRRNDPGIFRGADGRLYGGLYQYIRGAAIGLFMNPLVSILFILWWLD